MILLIDNYDSFTYNLAHLFGELGAEVTVRRNDAIDAAEAERLAPSHLLLSPGPGRPRDAGAVLYALPGEALDACIAIRTIVLDDGVALLQAGAGIVADSDPGAEHNECLQKLAALETAIDLAEARK